MRKFGLIGFPLTHSFSPAWFAEKFRRENIHDASYSAYPLPELSELSELLRSEEELCGLNVTIPYKEKIIPLLAEISPEAKAIGAVNTIRVIRRNNEIMLSGTNTDAHGFRISIRPFLEGKHHKALILGSGGAAKSVRYVLGQLGIQNAMVSRRTGKADLSYSELEPGVVESCKLIIHCTPSGMFPDTDACPPLPDWFFNHIGPDHFLYDLIYNPPETIFLKKGKERGAITLNGLSMLQHQAEESWRIWGEKDTGYRDTEI